MHSFRLLLIASIMTVALLPMAIHALPVTVDTSSPVIIAQDKTAETQPVQEKTAETSTAQEEAPATGTNTHPFRFNLGLAYGSLDVSGNAKRYEQYVTPPQGGYFTPLSLQYLSPAGHTLADINLYDLGQPSMGGKAWLSLASGNLVFDGEQRRSEFYRDWSPVGQPLTRNNDSYSLSGQLGHSELLLSYNNVRLAGQFNTIPEDWTLSTPSASYTVYLNNWRSSLGYGKEDFSFSQGAQFSGTTSTTEFHLSPPTSERTSLEASAAVTNTTLDGVSTKPAAYAVEMEGSQTLNRDLTVNGQVSYGEITSTITENAYANREAVGEVQAQYSGISRTLFDLGAGVRHVGYLNTPQTANIAADVRSLYAKVNTRLSKQLKLKGSISGWWTNGAPASVSVNGVQNGTLVWTSRDIQCLEASYSPNWRSGVTAQWRKLGWKNIDFNTDNSIIEHNVFGWWMPFDKITLYATYLRQNYGLFGPAATTVDAPFVSNGETVQYGASYQFTPALLLDVDYTHANTWGAEGVNQHIWSLGLNYALHSGDSFAVRAVLDDFNTSVNLPMDDYRGNWFEIRYTKAVF